MFRKFVPALFGVLIFLGYGLHGAAKVARETAVVLDDAGKVVDGLSNANIAKGTFKAAKVSVRAAGKVVVAVVK